MKIKIQRNKMRYMVLLLVFTVALSAQQKETEVRTYKVKHVDLEILKNQIRPYLSPSGSIEINKSENKITITDIADNQRKISQVIKQIDVAENSPYKSNRSSKNYNEKYLMETIALKNISSAVAVRLLRDVVTSSGSSQTANSPGIRMTSQVKFKEMEGVNSILVIANKDDMRIIKSIIRDLDTGKSSKKDGRKIATRVIFLQNTNAPEVADILERMKDNRNASSNSGQQGGANTSGNFLNSTSVISALESTNSLVIMAREKDMPEIITLIKKIDKIPPQVLIEIIIFEVTLKNGTSFGTELSVGNRSSAVGANGVGQNKSDFGIKSKYADGADGRGYSFRYNDEYIDALLVALEETGDVKILSAPQVLVANNKQAEISIGDSVVIDKETLEIPTADASTPIVRTTHDYIDIGLRLLIAPKINDDIVYMDILQEVNDIKESGVPGFPEIAKRTMETSIIVKDSESAVLGGLISRKRNENISKVPFLGDFPVLGRLFRKTESEIKSTELILFVTAYVVTDQEQLMRLTEKQKNRLKSIRLNMLKKERK
ncbi:MAG: secretin N-terminal domain-containing protein [Leptospirales bacterium]